MGRNRQKAEAKRRLEEAELMRCTFAPNINAKSKKLATSKPEVQAAPLPAPCLRHHLAPGSRLAAMCISLAWPLLCCILACQV
jgi:hypothetical protein